MRNRTRFQRRGRLALATAAALSGCAPSGSDVVTLHFMQNKPETVEYFGKLVTRFEKENPGIRVIPHTHNPTTTVRD